MTKDRSRMEYVVAIGATVMALVARSILDPFLGNHLPYVTFFVAVAVTTYYGGLGASFAAVVLGGMAAQWFFMPPRHSFYIFGLPQQVGIATYFLVTLAFVGLGQALRRARHQAETAAEGLRREATERRAAEQALERSEARLRLFVEHAPAAIAMFDRDMRYLAASHRWLTDYALDEQLVIGRSHYDVFPDLPDRWREAHQRGLAGEVVITEEDRYHRLDGRVQWLHWEIHPWRTAGGSIGGISICTEDITPRKLAEEALRERQQQLQLITDTAPVAIAHCDVEGRYKFVNRPYAHQFGLQPQDCLGKKMEHILGGDTYQRRRTYVDEALRGESVEFDAEVPAEEGPRWMHCTYVPEFRSDGAVNGLVAVLNDMTAYRQTQESLKRQLDITHAIAANSTQALFMIDTQGYCTFMNRAAEAMFGFSSEEMRQRPLHEMVHHHGPDGRPYPIADCPFNRALPEHRAVRDCEDTFIRKNGDWFPALVAASPIYKDGCAVSTVLEVQDITERKRGETALRESQDRLRAFAGQLEQLVEERTTELVRSQAQLRALATELNLTEQRERKQLAVELHDHLAQMLVLTKMKLSQMKQVPGVAPRCLNLISQADDVLTQSLSYTRTLVADLAPPVLHDFGLPAGLKWLAEHLRQHDLTVEVHVADGDLRLPEEQAVLLFQSVRELLMNVVKHAATNQATVSLEQREDRLSIAVRDQGSGFDVDQAFNAAARYTDATATSSKFGLFSIRERMHALGGQFTLSSTPGEGTLATLMLPLSLSRAEARGEGIGASGNAQALNQPGGSLPPASRRSPSGLSRIRVLLVDDHAMVRQGLRSILDGYADIEVVGEASDGLEAIDEFERLRPAVVVMDINMPKKSGVEATAAIKAQAQETVIIGLSVNAGGESQQAMRAAGAAMLLTKETAVDQLYQAIQEAGTAL
jgi:PAS domain S-box-containing protein